ncbi:MAG: S-layer homology domain-containing protein [Leptolyngbya sp. DLM2.Bin27]|nr:MAG: S-layer homology domain-containing protein [Leptolyngbya sp. DLM2.Bin27]
MTNIFSWGALVRLGLVGCERGLLAAAVLLMSATAAVATGPAPTAEAGGAEALEGEAGVDGRIAIAAPAPQLEAWSVAELSGALAAESQPAPLQLASQPTTDTESAAMFRVDDLEAGLEADATVRPVADLAQVTRVTDFSDVSPADWAFQALSNLVETYGCLQGYPDGSFRGHAA